MDKEYLTVREFATAANISTQRLYKLFATNCKGIANEMQQYCKIENNRKYIHRDALQLFENATELQTDGNTDATDTALKAVIETLQEQLRVKDNQISELQTALRAEQEHSAQLTTALTQQQALHAGTIQQQLEQHEPQSELDVPTPSEDQEEQPAPVQEKRSLFARIFKRK